MIPHSSDPSLLVTGGSIATTIRSGTRSGPAPAPPRSVEHRRRPERAVEVQHELAVELLPPQRGAAVPRGHLLQKTVAPGASGSPPSAPASPPCRTPPPASAASDCPRRRRHHRPRPLARAAARTAACPRRPRPWSTCRPRRTRPRRTAARAASPDRGPRRSAPRRRSARPAACASPAIPAAGRGPSRRGCRSARKPSPRAPGRASRRSGRPGSIAPGRPASPPSTCARTHSAPARVLPAPRPPRMTQVVQSPSGGS